MKNLKLRSVKNLILFFSLLILTNSCKKDNLSNIQNSNIENLRLEFEKKKIPVDLLGLTQPINGDTIIWEIQWDSKGIKVDTKSGNTYTYIPIIPRLKSKRSVKTYLFSRYLLITKIDYESHYSLAYAFDDVKMASSNFNKSKFSGILQLKNLESGSLAQYHFANGLFKGMPKPDNKMMSMGKAMAFENCNIIYSCSWGTMCSGGIVYITFTTGNSCDSPPIMFDPCGNSSDTVPWSFNGSREIGRNCFPTSPEIDPPAPPGGGTFGGGDTNPKNTLAETEPTTFHYTLADPTELKKQFKCFDQISDANTGAYLMSISVDLPVNDDPDKLVTTATFPPSPGHVFITLTKLSGYDPATGITSVSKSFGFYPSPEVLSLSTQGVGSKIVDDGGREWNASKNIFLTKEEFQQVMDNAVYLAGHKAYDINDYNCADYGLDVWNTLSNETLSVSDWIGPSTQFNYGRTPNGLYKVLAQKKSYGDMSISLSSNSNDKAPAKTSSCQ